MACLFCCTHCLQYEEKYGKYDDKYGKYDDKYGYDKYGKKDEVCVCACVPWLIIGGLHAQRYASVFPSMHDCLLVQLQICPIRITTAHDRIH